MMLHDDDVAASSRHIHKAATHINTLLRENVAQYGFSTHTLRCHITPAASLPLATCYIDFV